MAGLLTYNEAKKLARMDGHFPSCKMDDINEVVDYEFLSCLGKAFREQLEADLDAFENAKEYLLSKKDYKIGEQVIFNNTVYNVVKDDPQDSPIVQKSFYELADKFKTPCLQNLWCDGYLGRYLSLLVYKSTLGGSGAKLSDQGIVKSVGQNFVSGSVNDVKAMHADVDRKISRAYNLMVDYMQNNNGDDCYNLSKLISSSSCGDCGCEVESCECDNGCKEGVSGSDYYEMGDNHETTTEPFNSLWNE